MSVAVAGAAPGAAAVVDGAGTDAGGLGGSDDEEVGVVHAPDITHDNTNTNAPMAITLIKSRSMVASTLGAQPDTVPKIYAQRVHCAAVHYHLLTAISLLAALAQRSGTKAGA